MLPSCSTHFIFGVWCSVYPGVQHLWGYVVWSNTYETLFKKLGMFPHLEHISHALCVCAPLNFTLKFNPSSVLE